MSNPSKKKGTWFESAVVRYLMSRGIQARREALHGNRDHGDIHVTTRYGLLVMEAKWRPSWPSARAIEGWLNEAEVERVNAGGVVCAVVVNRPGTGAPNAGDWLVYMPAEDWQRLRSDARGPVRPPGGWVCVDLAHFATAVTP